MSYKYEYNFIYDEKGKKRDINYTNPYNAITSYHCLPDMSAEIILKNNTYIREISEQKLPCIWHDIVHQSYNASGAMYIIYTFILKKFVLQLEHEAMVHSTKQAMKYLEVYQKLIPELLYRAKYVQFEDEKPDPPHSYLKEVDKIPERIRFAFFLSMAEVCNRYRGMSSCFSYVGKALGYSIEELRYSKNEYADCISILYSLFDTYTSIKK